MEDQTNYDEFAMLQLTPDDWHVYRELRLEALHNFPNYFSPSVSEVDLTESDWRARLANPNVVVFVLEVRGAVAGLTGIFFENSKDGTSVAHFIMSYIREEFRGRGFSQKLFDGRFSYLQKRGGTKRVVICHREGNRQSEAAILRNQFIYVESTQQRFLDGSEAMNLVYHREL